MILKCFSGKPGLTGYTAEAINVDSFTKRYISLGPGQWNQKSRLQWYPSSSDFTAAVIPIQQPFHLHIPTASKSTPTSSESKPHLPTRPSHNVSLEAWTIVPHIQCSHPTPKTGHLRSPSRSHSICGNPPKNPKHQESFVVPRPLPPNSRISQPSRHSRPSVVDPLCLRCRCRCFSQLVQYGALGI